MRLQELQISDHVIECAYKPTKIKTVDSELVGDCPKCGRYVTERACNYCPRCGCKLDWSRGNNERL